ncbi:hypothetical protein A6R68_18374 [Neotoma lepida]|uniref:Uncharacterized protein n=1 Tax=Neotoma lepida TaxID=56216 RepID=A0A1A6HMQ9_NEOLE|nr:hypothetical protein A6R68_18374 [Neotoma lepida]
MMEEFISVISSFPSCAAKEPVGLRTHLPDHRPLDHEGAMVRGRQKGVLRPVEMVFTEREEGGEEKEEEEESVTRFLRIPLHMRIWAYRTTLCMHTDCMITLLANYVITQHTDYIGRRNSSKYPEPPGRRVPKKLSLHQGVGISPVDFNSETLIGAHLSAP